MKDHESNAKSMVKLSSLQILNSFGLTFVFLIFGLTFVLLCHNQVCVKSEGKFLMQHEVSSQLNQIFDTTLLLCRSMWQGPSLYLGNTASKKRRCGSESLVTLCRICLARESTLDLLHRW